MYSDITDYNIHIAQTPGTIQSIAQQAWRID